MCQVGIRRVLGLVLKRGEVRHRALCAVDKGNHPGALLQEERIQVCENAARLLVYTPTVALVLLHVVEDNRLRVGGSRLVGDNPVLADNRLVDVVDNRRLVGDSPILGDNRLADAVDSRRLRVEDNRPVDAVDSRLRVEGNRPVDAVDSHLRVEGNHHLVGVGDNLFLADNCYAVAEGG